jgi:hypothetical protein
MVMDYLKKRIENAETNQEIATPEWVSKDNASLKAWQYVEQLKNEKELYIKHHKNITDYLTKKPYQIKGSDIAKALKINRSSLMNTSKYSCHFVKYLNNVNAELVAAKEAQLKKAKNSPSRGSIRNSKEELVLANTELRKRVTELETLKTEELVSRSFDHLPLPIRKKLGID